MGVMKIYLHKDTQIHLPRVFLLAATAVADVDLSSATSASLRAPSSSSSRCTSSVFSYTKSIVRDVGGTVPTFALPAAPSSEVAEIELVTEGAGVERALERLPTCTEDVPEVPEAVGPTALACLRAIAAALLSAIL